MNTGHVQVRQRKSLGEQLKHAAAHLRERSASSAPVSKEGRAMLLPAAPSAIGLASAMDASSGPAGALLGGSCSVVSAALPSFCTP